MLSQVAFRSVAVLAMLAGCHGNLGGSGGEGPDVLIQSVGAGPNQSVGAGPNQTVGANQGPAGNQTSANAQQAATQQAGQTTGGGIDSATLTWDANTEADLAGYKVYHSDTSQMYTLGSPVAVVPTGTMVYVATGLASGRHYFSVTAYDTSDNESALSMEVFKDIP